MSDNYTPRERITELLAERDALRAEVERLNAENNRLHVALGRLLRAAQSLHRAWRRERRAHLEQRGERIEWVINYECVAAENNRLRAEVASMAAALCRSDMRDGLLTRLLYFVNSLRADGLDIDDPTTSPCWTGKIHAPDGRLVFDLATVGEPSGSALLDKLREVTAGLHASTGIPYSALCHYQDRPHCAGCPDDATCEARGREPRKP